MIDVCINRYESQKVVDNYFGGTKIVQERLNKKLSVDIVNELKKIPLASLWWEGLLWLKWIITNERHTEIQTNRQRRNGLSKKAYAQLQ